MQLQSRKNGLKAEIPQVKLCGMKVPQGAKQIGNYIIGKTIGSGSSGKVHLGLHVVTGEKVAIKIIEKKKLKQCDMQRIEQQLQILKRILHPSLIHLYQIMETQKSLLLVTQYIEGGELFDFIIQKKKLLETQARSIFHQIIDGLQYMHSLGIAHRDIKPQNILVDSDAKIKIIDFGLNQKLQTVCGSPCYVPPEMIQQTSSYDPLLADIWSTGIVLFAMLMGYLPFCDPDTSVLYQKILNGNLKFPLFVSKLGKDLISKILTVDPLKRMSLQQIMKHPWYQSIEIKKSNGIDPKSFKIPIDKTIIQIIQNFGLKGNQVIESIQNNKRNKESSLYYMIAKKLVRQGHSIPSFFGCQNFDVSLLIPLQENKLEYAIGIESISVAPIVDFNAPTTTAVELYDAKSHAFKDLLTNFLCQKENYQDKAIAFQKGWFYNNNPENKRKNKKLVIPELKQSSKIVNLFNLHKIDRNNLKENKQKKETKQKQEKQLFLNTQKTIASIYLASNRNSSKIKNPHHQSHQKKLPLIANKRAQARSVIQKYWPRTKSISIKKK